MKKEVKVFVYFDKVEETEEERIQRQAELFLLLAEMKRKRG
jgi:hypothetical protein